MSQKCAVCGSKKGPRVRALDEHGQLGSRVVCLSSEQCQENRIKKARSAK